LKAITLLQQPAPDQQVYPTVEAASLATSRDASQLTTELGEIATSYFKKFTAKTEDVDTAFGVHDRGWKFHVGDSEITIDQVDIIVGDNALKRNNDPNEAHPKSSRSPKWVNLLKPIWNEFSRSGERTPESASRVAKATDFTGQNCGSVGETKSSAKQHTGTSVQSAHASSHIERVIAHEGHAEQVGFSRAPIQLPSNPIVLLDRLDVLLANHGAGNTGVCRELDSMRDELRRHGIVDDSKYNYLINLI
jgi:hypothetical protein